ncbi:MAG TPA: glycosyltransferase [Candidatus Angelobacter sp.]|nr:glycosyltransferase [Candidatus Angelobacter sp.]
MSSARKRVLFLMPSFTGGVGGAERVLSTLVRHLDHSRFECHLALLQAGHTDLENIPQEVTVHQLHVSRMRYALPALVSLIWKVRPDSVLSTVAYLNVLLVLAKPLLPMTTRVLLREATTPSAFIADESANPKLWKWFYRHLYPRADKIICLSNAMMLDLRTHFGISEEKMVRIYNPVDVERIHEATKDAINPFSEGKKNLVTAGRLQRPKGFDVLIDALPGILERIPEVQLTILGEGPLESELKQQAQRLGVNKNVAFLGFKANPWHYFKFADVFILPSRFEGLPNAVLEALALGKKVVATDCPGALREVQESVGPLMLVPRENSDELANAVVAVLQNGPAAPIELEDIQRALEQFSVRQSVESYSALL